MRGLFLLPDANQMPVANNQLVTMSFPVRLRGASLIRSLTRRFSLPLVIWLASLRDVRRLELRGCEVKTSEDVSSSGKSLLKLVGGARAEAGDAEVKKITEARHAPDKEHETARRTLLENWRW